MAKNYTVSFGTGDPRGLTGLAPTFLSFYNLATGTTNTPPTIAETITGKTGIYTFTFGTTQPISFLIDAATTSPGANGRYVIGQIDPADRADEYGNTMIALGMSAIALGMTGIALGTTMVGFGGTGVALTTNLGSSFLAFGQTSIALGNSGQALGVTSVAIGTTLVGLGNTGLAFGSTNSALLNNMGSTLVGVGNSLSALGISGFAQGQTLIGLMGNATASIGSTAIDPTSVFGFLMRAQELSEGNQTYTKATGILGLFSRGATLLRQKTISDTSSQTTKT